jgi:hypothetical protein
VGPRVALTATSTKAASINGSNVRFAALATWSLGFMMKQPAIEATDNGRETSLWQACESPRIIRQQQVQGNLPI